MIFLLIPHKSPISFKYELSFWLLNTGSKRPFGSLPSYFFRIACGTFNRGTFTAVSVF